MKKFLSLVLALVMTMSLVTISAGAKDFTDDEKITYDEAVNVISEIGVVGGYTDGTFKPQDVLTRGAAAKIICNMILGPTTASELRADTAPFKDVPTNHTFAGYIAYCAKAGIISGYADGTFKPGNTLTGYAFMKMLLGALGYDSNIEGYVGANWSISVAKRAKDIGLNKGLEGEFNGVKAVNREEACLYAFNTLQADLVEYDTSLGINAAGNLTSNSIAKAQQWNNSATRIDHIEEDEYIQFAEQYFTKLEKVDDTDDFMRPAHTWTYNKQEIGTYVDTDKLVEAYTEGVTGKDVYDLLKSTTIRDNDLECWVDGEANKDIEKTDLVRANDDDLEATGDGVLTEIYLDTDDELITIVSINTYLAQATADYNEKKEYAPLNVFLTDDEGTNRNVDVADVKNVVDVEEDQFYLVNVSYKDSSVGEVVAIDDVEILEDSTITKFTAKNGDKDDKAGYVTKVTTGGTQYKRNEMAFYKDEVLDTYNVDALTDSTYTIYLDKYGYFIGIELFEGSKNYVFITGYDLNGSNIAVANADAAAIFTDGTMKAIKVDVKDTNENIESLVETKKTNNYGYFQEWTAAVGEDGYSVENNWYTYTVDKDGVYTLKPCDRMSKSTFEAPAAGQDGPVITTDSLILDDDGKEDKDSTRATRIYGEDATIFLTVEKGDVTKTTVEGITDVTGVYTGVQNVDIEIFTEDEDTLTMVQGTGEEAEEVLLPQVYAVYDSDNYVIAAVVLGEATGATGNYAYVLSTVKSEEIKDDTYYWEFEAVLDGEVQTLTAKGWSKTMKRIINASVSDVLELRFDGDYVVNVKDVDDRYTQAEYTTRRIDGEDIYDVKITEQTTLNLQGKTLYVTEDQSDYGLALSADCKAVTIQDENGSGEKTEFSNVKSAIAHLADGNVNKEGTQFKGRIVAALDSKGVAQWIVFENDYELKTGKENEIVEEADLDEIALTTDGDLTITLTEATTAKSKFNLNLSVMNGGAWVDLGSYSITVNAGETTGTVNIGKVLDGVQYKVTGSFNTYVVAEAPAENP